MAMRARRMAAFPGTGGMPAARGSLFCCEFGQCKYLAAIEIKAVAVQRVGRAAVAGLALVGAEVTHAVDIGHAEVVLVERIVVEVTVVADHRRRKINGGRGRR